MDVERTLKPRRAVRWLEMGVPEGQCADLLAQFWSNERCGSHFFTFDALLTALTSVTAAPGLAIRISVHSVGKGAVHSVGTAIKDLK